MTQCSCLSPLIHVCLPHLRDVPAGIPLASSKGLHRFWVYKETHSSSRKIDLENCWRAEVSSRELKTAKVSRTSSKSPVLTRRSWTSITISSHQRTGDVFYQGYHSHCHRKRHQKATGNLKKIASFRMVAANQIRSPKSYLGDRSKPCIWWPCYVSKCCKSR